MWDHMKWQFPLDFFCSFSIRENQLEGGVYLPSHGHRFGQQADFQVRLLHAEGAGPYEGPRQEQVLEFVQAVHGSDGVQKQTG